MRKLTLSQIEQLCQCYQAGKSSGQLATSFGISSVAVRGLLKRRGLARRSLSEARRMYQCNHAFFTSVTSEQQAYWLGFIAADGYIDPRGVLTISLALRDRHHLVCLAASLESTHPIREYIYPKVRFARLYLRSKQLCHDLSAYGVIPNKTFSLPFPKLPGILIPHFLRGYTDGDGGFCITANGIHPTPNLSFHLTSNKPFLRDCQTYFQQELGLRQTKLYERRKGHGIYTLRYCGQRQVRRIADLLYRDATIYLSRKHAVLL